MRALGQVLEPASFKFRNSVCSSRIDSLWVPNFLLYFSRGVDMFINHLWPSPILATYLHATDSCMQLIVAQSSICSQSFLGRVPLHTPLKQSHQPLGHQSSNSKVKLEERSYRSDRLAVTDVHSSPADIYRLIAPERGPKRKHPVPVDHGTW